jgi:hypothetical protein
MYTIVFDGEGTQLSYVDALARTEQEHIVRTQRIHLTLAGQPRRQQSLITLSNHEHSHGSRIALGLTPTKFFSTEG